MKVYGIGYLKIKKDNFSLSFDEIEKVCNFPIDHSFLSFKQELISYGFQVGKISMKEKSVEFIKL